MYRYIKEEDLCIFDELEEKLLKIGVSKSHIIDMQNKILKGNERSVYYDYPPLDSKTDRYTALVPLDKVVSVSRGDIGWSVYDNVRKIYGGTRSAKKFKGCFDFLKKMSLEELKESYQELFWPVVMVYYVEEDEYHVSGDGNHRTLTAMLLGANKIKAEVTNARCNVLKKRKYESGKAFEEKYSINKIICNGRRYDIEFQDEKGNYVIRGYEWIKDEEDAFSFIDRLSATIDDERALAERVAKYPKCLQKFILKKSNFRIKAYMEKEYVDTSDVRYIYGYIYPIQWETL